MRPEHFLTLTVAASFFGMLAGGCGNKEGVGSASGTASATGATTLTWTANTEPDLAGYKVYIGTASGTFGSLAGMTNPIGAAVLSPISTGKGTTFQVMNLPVGQTYYFSVTAVDTSNNESGFSNEASRLVGVSDSGIPVRQTATYYVAQTGSDNNSCSDAMSEATPKLTINAGITCLGAGDTLIVKDGTYDESFEDPFSNTGSSWTDVIVVKAASPRRVIIKPASGDNVISFRSAEQKYIELNGIVIDAINIETDGVNIEANANHIRLYDCVILNAGDQGVSIFKEGDASPDFNEFINVEVANTAWNRACFGKGDPTPENGYCHGFYVSSDNNLLDGVNLHHNNGYGLQFYPQGNRGNTIRNSVSHDNLGVGIGSLGDGNRVINNVVYRNDGGGLLIDETNNLVYNNTVYDNDNFNGFDGLTIEGTGHSVKNNLFFINNVFGMALDATNLVGTDPQFEDAANDNFRLKAGSVAIDTGTTLPEVTRAIDGIPRPQGAAPDIGAYEFTTATGDIIPPAPPRNLRAL